jgi:type I restriction enzyme M protein
VRFQNKKLAWYTAAYLLSDEGQRQIYRYINGSSGQVEIYPQDIARIWVPRADDKKVTSVAERFEKAVIKYEEFQSELSTKLSDL